MEECVPTCTVHTSGGEQNIHHQNKIIVTYPVNLGM